MELSTGLRAALTGLLFSGLAACGGDGGFTSGDGGGGGGGGTAGVDTVTLQSDSSELPSDANTVDEGVILTLVATDADNNVVVGAAVTFSATSGEIQVLDTATDGSGRARAVLTTASNTQLRTITVAANADGVGTTRDIQVVAPSSTNPPVYRAGILDGTTFTNGQILVTAADPLSAGGSTGLRLDIVDSANGNAPFTGTAQVQFSSQCISQGIARVDPNPVQVFNGTVSATYVALGCSGTDQVTAQVNVDGTPLTATGSVTVLAANIGSIEFVSATPTTIGIAGSGQTETSTVVFRVLNASGGPVVNQLVQFSLNTSVGGISITPSQGTTNTQGQVQTVVKSGTVNTAVRVTARTTQGATTLTSQSEQLVVSTGLPDQNSFSVSAGCFNIEGGNFDNETTNITLLAADRFNNPVPDGTAISFVSEGGAVQPNCLTANGECTVTWRSQDPRPPSFTSFLPGAPVDNGFDVVGGQQMANGPRAGRSTVLVTAVGEESFVDLNGDGRFDDGEGFGDLAEAFRDDNGNGQYDPADGVSGFPGEEFVDFNSNGTRDAPSGSFTGFLCNGPANCDPASRSLSVRGGVTIIMSGSSPQFDALRDLHVSNAAYDESGIEMAAGGVAVLQFVIRDGNFQPMPAQTTISVSQDGDAGDFVGTSSFVVPCTTDDSLAGNRYGFAYKTEAIDDPLVASTNSAIELSVVSPRGLNTIDAYGLTAYNAPFVAIRAINRAPQVGETVRLSWASAIPGGGSCTASGGWSGPVPDSGTFELAATGSGIQAFTLTCSNADMSISRMDTVQINVQP